MVLRPNITIYYYKKIKTNITMAQNKIIKPRTIEVSIVCDEFNVADVLRDFANYIEENDLDFSGNPQFEGDDYEGEIKLV